MRDNSNKLSLLLFKCVTFLSLTVTIDCAENNIIAGPTLVFRGTEIISETMDNAWVVSAMVVTKKNDKMPPDLTYLNQNNSPETIEFLNVIKDSPFEFLRYTMRIKMTTAEQKISYKIGAETGEFYVPGSHDTPHILYTSCNDMDKEGTDRNWGSVLMQHNEKPIHLGLGGGDQIYCDGILDIPDIKSLLAQNDNNTTFVRTLFSEDLAKEVLNFYINNYIRYLQHPAYKKILSSVPHLNMNDDHEIFDGWGSYPVMLQNCEVMTGIFQIAQQVYLGFQHHMQESEAQEKYGYLIGTTRFQKNNRHFNRQSFSFLREVNSCAILGLDHRGERTREKILSQGVYDEIYTALGNISSQCKHLLLMVGVPIVFPDVSATHSFFDAADPYSDHNTLFKKISHSFVTAITGKDAFGLSEPTDDIVYDHWECKEHIAERDNFIRKIMQFANNRFLEKKPIRISLLSGDIHLAAAGAISPERPIDRIAQNPFFIMQLISSGIGSKWESAFLLKLLELTAAKKQYIEKNDNTGPILRYV